MSRSSFTDTLPKTLRLWAARPWTERLSLLVTTRSLAPIWLVAILLVAAAFRLTGIDWDANKHLHPDERFLTSVANDILPNWRDDPDATRDYFDPQASPLSPYSLPNMGLYVYGTLPLYLVKGVAIALDQNNYDAIAIVGRALSALFDLGAILFLFLLGRRLYGDTVALLGAALLALSVLNIQLSHFFTVDTFANLFVVMAVYFAVRASEGGRWGDYALMGLSLGAGMASKLSVLTLGVPILLAAGLDFYRRMRRDEEPVRAALERSVVRLLTVAALAALTFRVLQPIAFQGPEFWNFSLNPVWQEDIEEQAKIVAGEVDAPPWHQWTNRPALLFPLENMVLWGLGVPLGLAAWAGWGLGLYELLWRKRVAHLLPVAFVGAAFLYHGMLWVKFMRYFLPIYPFLALLAAYLLVWVFRRVMALEAQRAVEASAPAGEGDIAAADDRPIAPSAQEGKAGEPSAVASSSRRALTLALLPTIVVLAGTLLWALAFTSIYTRPHSRIVASRWIFANVPPGTMLANEHWDDNLPLGVDGKEAFGESGYRNVEMPNYEDDTPEKLERMVDAMSQADYIILSSNRLYDSIPRLPMRYPMTTRYYELLFQGQLGYQKVADFTSYPQLLGIQIPDQGAEEAFSVYDHPRVQIFKKTPEFNPDAVRAALSSGVNWDEVARLTPRQATATPDMLQLSLLDRSVYSLVAEQIGPPPWAWLARQVPALAWALAVELLGLAALPFVLVALGGLRDRGYILAKTAGLLLVGWGAWLLASWRALPFAWWSVLLVAVGLALASGGIWYRRRAELAAFWRGGRRIILIEEALFWGFFLALLFVRWQNPDLWHPVMGGEKPMDTAYLNAIATTPFFPSYDPWYAGGYINYYYFGFVLIAALIHLTGVEVTTAYNLAVPMLFAMTATGAFCVVYNLVWGAERQGQAGKGAEEQEPPAALPPDGAQEDGQAHAAGSRGRPGAPPPRARGGAGRLARLLVGERGALAAGLLGALFVTVIGNLGQLQLLVTGLQNVSNIEQPENPSPLLPFARAFDGLMELLFNGRELNFRQEWWYWNATRIIPPGQNEAGPINEFPFFTFLFADLHAHMMALPLTLLALAICVCIVRGAGADGGGEVSSGKAATGEDEAPVSPRRSFTASLWERARAIGLPEALLLALLALTIGALWPTNTWDFPTYAALAGAALLCRAYAGRQALDQHTIWAAGWRWGLAVALGYVLFRPYHQHSASAYFGVEQWKGSHTPLWAYLLIHGFFLFIIVSWMLSELTRGRGHSSVARLFGVALRHWRRPGRLRRLYRALVRPSRWHELALSLLAPFALGLLALAALGIPAAAVGLGLAALAALLLLSPRPAPRRQLILCMIGVGLLLTAVVELVVLKGDISRMNTVFKFYLQVWVLWGAAAAAALPDLAARLGARRRAEAAPQAPQTLAPAPRLWWRTFWLLLAGCALYTVTATPGRIDDRFEGVSGATLDGEAYMQTAVYFDQEQPIALEWDREAIDWLRENVRGTPAIVEANTPLYRWGSRVAIYSGLPTVIGWDWHQKQQRSILPGDLIDRRINDVRSIYTDPDPEVARRLLRLYNVEYIYVGQLERMYYAGDGLEKFERLNGQLWDLVYENPEVRIYRVRLS